MPAKKTTKPKGSRKSVKDLSPRKGAAAKVKGGVIVPKVSDKLRVLKGPML